MKIGIVGLPNVGKSTLFNSLTKTYAADAANFPFCTIEPNVGIVDVLDPRVDTLAEISKTQKKIYASIQFVDIAWLVKWASQWAWLGNKFLSHIRETDAIVQVLRYFKDNDVVHVEGWVDPMRDVEIINTELIIADLEQVERNVQQLEKRLKAQDKDSVKLYPILKRICDVLKSGGLIYSMVDELTEEERMLLKPYNLLTNKPFVYAINIGTEDFADADKIKKEFEDKLQRPVAIVCAKLESEMLGFTAEERAEYVEAEFGESYVPTLDSLISLAYDTVGLMYYFTTGEKETRAWTIKKNSTAPEASAAIHNDFQKKFIKAEVVSCDNFIAAWSRTAAKEKWFLKLEWKEYIVQDGDIIVFKIGG
jgi:ribosome-binding ATPase